MNAKLYLYVEDKDAFVEITKVSSKDVVFLVDMDEQKVFVWQGKESPRMLRYKGGMKVATLISTMRLYNFKSEVVTEGEEPEPIREFMAQRFGKRDMSPAEIARDDRLQVEAKAKAISDKFSHREATAAPQKPKPPTTVDRPALARAEGTPAPKPEAQSPASAAAKRAEPKEPRPPTTIQDELRRVNLGIGRDMAASENISLEKKKFLSKDERDVVDEVRREQSRSDNLASVQETKLWDEERKRQLREQEEARQRELEAEKRRTEAAERERLASDKRFMEEKLRKEKEALERDRHELEDKLREEELARKNEQEAAEKAREARKKDLVEFEVRKIDLRMQIRRKGIDYIVAPPPEGSRILYRIDKGIAVKMEPEYMTMGDVYVLDKGNRVFVWNGKLASLDERFFGDEIAKLLKEKRSPGTEVVSIEQAEEPADFVACFDSLSILDGNYAESILKKEQVGASKGFIFYRVKTEGGLLFMEMPKEHASVTSNDSFLFDFGKDIIVWHGRDSNPEERQRSVEIAALFQKERGAGVKVRVHDEGREPGYEQFPAPVWPILKGEERAAEMAEAYRKAASALDAQRHEAALKQQQEEEAKRLLEEKKALDEMERIEREMLQKEIERKKAELTPQQIEAKWRDFRRKMRERRGLPPEDEAIKIDLSTGESITDAPAAAEPAPEVDKAQLKKQKEKEFEQLKRIELEMLEKRLAREKPAADVEARWRADLQAKLDGQWKDIQEESKD
ncbi:MAG: hypothetical protein JW839_17625 [Candidatus Lokiarchaeota archaeon]|nr:hypothetical protein [Candidatus Lokiarchaeota archaeon]